MLLLSYLPIRYIQKYTSDNCVLHNNLKSLKESKDRRRSIVIGAECRLTNPPKSPYAMFDLDICGEWTGGMFLCLALMVVGYT